MAQKAVFPKSSKSGIHFTVLELLLQLTVWIIVPSRSTHRPGNWYVIALKIYCIQYSLLLVIHKHIHQSTCEVFVNLSLGWCLVHRFVFELIHLHNTEGLAEILGLSKLVAVSLPQPPKSQYNSHAHQTWLSFSFLMLLDIRTCWAG